MFKFNGITHVVKNGSGHAPGHNYSLVGAVPMTMLEARKPTLADVMGQRVAADGCAYHGRKWENVREIQARAAEVGARLCESPTCACRKLF